MLDLYDKIQAAVAAIRAKWDRTPKAGIILGTGLGGLVQRMQQEAEIDYGEVPHFLKSTVVSHRGRLVCGQLEGVPVIAMEGRFHMYEGYSLKDITFPVRVMKALGAEVLVVSNACGGMNPLWRPGDLVLISDHINLLGDNPLIGVNDDRLGPRFPDMSQPYDPALRSLAHTAAKRAGVTLRDGVYACVSGPNLETRAEYRMLRTIGADVVGMSTVPEVLVAIHAGMRVLGVSIITDLCLPDALEPATVERIIAVAKRAEPNLTALVRGVMERL